MVSHQYPADTLVFSIICMCLKPAGSRNAGRVVKIDTKSPSHRRASKNLAARIEMPEEHKRPLHNADNVARPRIIKPNEYHV